MKLTRLVAACLFLALLPCSLSAQELIVGRNYNGAVKLTDAMGGVYLPLPTGDWKLIGMETQLAQGLGAVPVLTGAFVSLDFDADKKPKALVTFSVAMAASTFGWAVPAFCSIKGLHYIEPKDSRENHDGGPTRCWGIQAQPMALTDKAAQYMHDAFDWVANNSAGIPVTTIRLSYYRTEGPKYFHVDYLFNPETVYFFHPQPAHFGAVSAMLWSPERVSGDAQQTAYIEAIKRFGVALKPILEHGFYGTASSASELAAVNISIPKIEPAPQPPSAAQTAGTNKPSPTTSTQTSSAGPYIQGQIIACSEEGKVKMRAIRGNVSLAFQNRQDKLINLYTLDQNGHRELRTTIQPLHNKRINMTLFRPWLVADANGQCLEIVMPGQNMPLFVLNN